MTPAQADAFVASFEHMPVQNIDDAAYSINLRFGGRSEAFAMNSLAFPALASVLQELGMEELYDRLPRPVFLAFIGMLSSSVPLESLDAGRHAFQYSRLMRVIGKTGESLIDRVSACADIDELALLLRLQFYSDFVMKKAVMLEVSPSDPLSRMGAQQLIRDFAPAQIFTLVYLMPIEQVRSIVSDLLKTDNEHLVRFYSDELGALVKAAILKADRIMNHPGPHLGAPALKDVGNASFSPLAFGFYTIFAAVTLESLLDVNLAPRLALSAAFGGMLQALTQRFWVHRLRQKRLDSAAKTTNDAIELGRDTFQCSNRLFSRIFPKP